MAVIETARFPRLSRARNSAVKSFDDFGDHALFFWRALVATPRALTQYPKETLRLIAEIAMGTGALAMIGGTVVIVAFLTLATGGVIAV
ncbi:YrbE family protein, partial [Dietzia cinnamea P4]